MRLGVVVALPAEARALFGRGAFREEGGWPVRRVELAHGFSVLAVRSGVGLERALPAARFLVARGVQGLVSAGVSGGLHPEMKPGDLVVGQSAMQWEGREEGADVVWEGRAAAGQEFHDVLAREGLEVRLGALLAGPEPVAAAGDKADWHGRTQALAVDMESAAVAHAAREAGLPFLALRAVSDAAGAGVPLDLFYMLDEMGRVRPWLLAKALLRNPGLIGGLVRLGRDYGKALKSLGRAWSIQAGLGFSGFFGKSGPSEDVGGASVGKMGALFQ